MSIYEYDLTEESSALSTDFIRFIKDPSGTPQSSNIQLTNLASALASILALADWSNDTNTWTYNSVDSPTGVISINADMTAILQKGTRVSYKQSQALTAYWTFDSSSAADVGTFTEGDIGTPTYTTGQFSNALTLDGSTDAISIADDSLLKPTGAFTVGARIKSSSTAGYNTIFQSFSQNTNSAGIKFQTVATSGIIQMVIGSNTGAGAASVLFGTTNVCDGAWHYIVYTQMNNYGQLYVDGVLEETQYQATPAYAATNYIRIGCSNNAGTNAGFFNGQIDDLFFINGYALDEKTIHDKYEAATAQGTSDITVEKMGIVTNVGAYSGGATLVTVYHGTDYMLANATITSPKYSAAKAPYGFPTNPDKWSVIVFDSTNYTKTSPTASTLYGQTNAMDGSATLPSISIPIGKWRLWYTVATAASRTATILNVFCTLSTSQTAASDAKLTASSTLGGASGTLYSTFTVFKETLLDVTAKLSYYLLIWTTWASTADISVYGSSGCTTVIRAVSAYL